MRHRRPPSPATPMTELDRDAINALERVTMLPASWEKRFTHDMVRAKSDARNITDRQRRALYAAAWKFRRQILAAGGKEMMAKVAIELATTQAAFENNREPSVQVARERTRVNPLDAVMKSQAELELG